MPKPVKPPQVFIVAGNAEYELMFRQAGWEITSSIYEADLVQFTGGADVNPALYGEATHLRTSFSEHRDHIDLMAFRLAQDVKVPMAGICRGGQFLNVMCDGTMWQDVEGHVLAGTHPAWDKETGEVIEVTSTHHQMMRPGADSNVVLVAHKAKWRERVGFAGNHFRSYDKSAEDIEAVHYPNKEVFCFQPHPEFAGREKLAKSYFSYLNKYLHV